MESIPGYDAWKTRTHEEDDHVSWCPQHEDAPEAYECGGIGEHLCSWWSRIWDDCPKVERPCACPTKKELKDEAAEARFDAEREG